MSTCEKPDSAISHSYLPFSERPKSGISQVLKSFLKRSDSFSAIFVFKYKKLNNRSKYIIFCNFTLQRCEIPESWHFIKIVRNTIWVLRSLICEVTDKTFRLVLKPVPVFPGFFLVTSRDWQFAYFTCYLRTDQIQNCFAWYALFFIRQGSGEVCYKTIEILNTPAFLKQEFCRFKSTFHLAYNTVKKVLGTRYVGIPTKMLIDYGSPCNIKLANSLLKLKFPALAVLHTLFA